MKLHKLFATFGLGLFALASVGAGLALSANEAKDVKADADPIPTANIVQYVDISGVTEMNWFDAGCSVQVHIFHSDGTNGHFASDITEIGTKIYSFTLEAGYSKLIVARYNGTWCNQSYDIEYSSDYNFYKIGNLSGVDNKFSYTRSNLSFVNQRDFVLDVRESYQTWDSGPADTYLYSVYRNSATISTLTRINGTNVYTGTFPDDYSERFLIVRGNGFIGNFNDGSVLNQTKDILFFGSNLNCSFVALGVADPNDGNKISVVDFEPISVDMFGEAWGYQFRELDICLDSGGLHDDFETNWTKAKTSFTNLKAEETGLVEYLAEAAASGPLYANAAVNEYDTAIVKNHLAVSYDFLERSPASAGAPIVSKTDTTTLIATITIVTLVAISSILVFVVIKKRKYN